MSLYQLTHWSTHQPLHSTLYLPIFYKIKIFTKLFKIFFRRWNGNKQDNALLKLDVPRNFHCTMSQKGHWFILFKNYDELKKTSMTNALNQVNEAWIFTLTAYIHMNCEWKLFGKVYKWCWRHYCNQLLVIKYLLVYPVKEIISRNIKFSSMEIYTGMKDKEHHIRIIYGI